MLSSENLFYMVFIFYFNLLATTLAQMRASDQLIMRESEYQRSNIGAPHCSPLLASLGTL